MKVVIPVKELAKKGIKFVANMGVDAAACGCIAAAVPVALMNPVVAGLVVLGGATSAMAFNDKVVNGFIDESVDNVCNYWKETVQTAKDAVYSIKYANEMERRQKEEAAKQKENEKENKESDNKKD